jgi:hypothetical protein
VAGCRDGCARALNAGARARAATTLAAGGGRSRGGYRCGRSRAARGPLDARAQQSRLEQRRRRQGRRPRWLREVEEGKMTPVAAPAAGRPWSPTVAA